MMNKKLIAVAVCTACAGATLLSSCGEVKASIEPAWYKNTTLNSNISNTKEVLTYKIDFEKGSNNTVTASYSNGVYTTTLVNGIYTWENNEVENVYIYTTEMSVDATFSANGQSVTYTDTISSEVIFSNAENSLKPIKSEKKAKTHFPMYASISSVETEIAEYEYTVTNTYNSSCTKGVSVYKDNDTEKKTEFEIEDDLTFLDNEQLLFAIRGLSLGANASHSLRTYDSSSKLVSEIIVSNKSVSTLTPTFTLGAEKTPIAEPITYNEASVKVNATQSGVEQICYYAAKTSATNNLYRNVMILNKVTMPYSIGTLVFSLENAVFTEK